MLEHKGYKHKYGSWSTKSIKRVLASKLYIGQIKHLDDYYKGIHEPLIDEETFNKAQILLQNRADAYVATGCKPGVQSTYLGGLTYCKKCGAKYTKQRGGSNKYGILYYYVCYSRGKVKKMIKDPNCKNKSYRMETLDNIIFDEIKKLSTDPEYIQTIKNEKNKNSDTPNKIDIIKKEILNIESQMSRFMDLYGLGNITIEQISEKIDPLNAQKKALERELENLNAESGSLSDEDTLEIVTSFSEILERGDFNEIRLAIESLIYYVEIDEDDVYIHWKFA
jgi:site-specific DNA recombinase